MTRPSVLRPAVFVLAGGVLTALLIPGPIVAEDALPPPEERTEAVAEPAESSNWLRTLTGLDEDNIAAPLRAVALVTIFGVVPSIVLLTTSFPRILVVLSFLRRALGAQDLPPNAVLFGLSLLLTGVVMTPLWRQVYEDAYVPLAETQEISAQEAYARAQVPIKRFLLSHTRVTDLRLMIAASERPRRAEAMDGESAGTTIPSAGAEDPPGDERPLEELGLFTILPAFVLSELKLAFQMGFLLFLPFLVIDLVVSAVLVSMGMIMLPPALVSLPLKILVFVLVDGWTLVVGQLLYGFQG